jgi:cytochrome c biogenesis protein CcdA
LGLIAVCPFFLSEERAPVSTKSNSIVLTQHLAGFGFPLVTISALIDSFNPCAFSVIFISLAFLASFGKDNKTVLRLEAGYIAGIFAAYLLIGLGLLQAMSALEAPRFMVKMGAVLLIAIGLNSLLSRYLPSLSFNPKPLARIRSRLASLIERSTVPSFAALGGIVGLAEFPCSGGPYLMILGLLHDQETFFTGLSYLLWYNLVFILPLLLVAAVSVNGRVIEKIRSWEKSENRLLKVADSLLMVALGLIILFF